MYNYEVTFEICNNNTNLVFSETFEFTNKIVNFDINIFTKYIVDRILYKKYGDLDRYTKIIEEMLYNNIKILNIIEL